MRDYDALIALVESRMRAPLAWGDDAHDCISFGDSAVMAQTGDSPIRRAGFRWSTQRGAMRVLARVGGLAAAVDLVLPRVAPAMARRGDVGLVEIEGRASLVVIEGDLIIGPGLDGLVRLPRALLKAAWSIA